MDDLGPAAAGVGAAGGGGAGGGVRGGHGGRGMNIDRTEAERLMARWDRLAWKCANDAYAKTRRGDRADYYAAAALGLWEAATRFDPARGVQFQTFATWWVMRRVREHARWEAAAGMHVPAGHGVVRVACGSLAPADDDEQGIDPPARAASPRPFTAAESAALWRTVAAAAPCRQSRTAVELLYRHGLNGAEAAESLGVSRNWVYILRDAAFARARRAVRVEAWL